MIQSAVFKELVKVSLVLYEVLSLEY
jgi:hypothetical protein